MQKIYYIWIQHYRYIAKRKITAYHSCDTAIVKSKRKMPNFMTLEYAYISFADNNIKETWKTF